LTPQGSHHAPLAATGKSQAVDPFGFGAPADPPPAVFFPNQAHMVGGAPVGCISFTPLEGHRSPLAASGESPAADPCGFGVPVVPPPPAVFFPYARGGGRPQMGLDAPSYRGEAFPSHWNLIGSSVNGGCFLVRVSGRPAGISAAMGDPELPRVGDWLDAAPPWPPPPPWPS
jgi:hypothetical protein